ncbi:uncharacterized protein N7469_001576 [Penicillium citrinum]|uniref:Arginine-requiring protein 2 n=1 Tax=Penicillium citrinum TaxID=5077 RepID=A0A9W9TWG0_PENCI|nr:uncharacterized protein N7469_001576 [Penicillium citrinum]KAJ5243249.1 hypothetical protein N7469_001576 [Penicillium citrinum]
MGSRVLNWPRTAQASLAKQHIARTNDSVAIRSAPSLPRAQQVAEFSNSSQNHDRLGHRAKEKLLDRVFRSFGKTPHLLRKVWSQPRGFIWPWSRSRTPQSLDDDVVAGVARTLSQLVRLGMACLVVVDPGKMDGTAARHLAIDQANRISAAVDEQPDSKSFRLDSALSLSEKGAGIPTVMSRKGLLSPLRDGHIVIVTPVAYLEENPRAVPISANDAVLSLTREFAGLSHVPDPDEDPSLTAERINSLQKEVSLDRVILLHPLGGIPAFRGPPIISCLHQHGARI